MKTRNYSKFIELLLLTILPPTTIIIYELQRFVIPIIIIFCILTIIYLKKCNYKFSPFLNLNRPFLYKIIRRILLIGILLICITYIFFPVQFMFLPIINFKLWLLIIIFYPILSVLPQEIIYRSFFFNRYSHLFNSKKYIILFNGIIFSLAHSIYLDFFIIILTFIAGIIFAKNYYCNRSIFLVTLEHSILGNIIFSLGLGHFFYQSNVEYIYSVL